MKKRLLRALALLLMLALCLIPAAAAFADGPDTIVAFELSEVPETITLDHKAALIELEKQFPAALTVYTGPDRTAQRLAVDWVCREDYDAELDAFSFVPAMGGYALAEGVSLPVITVRILGRPVHPVMPELPARERPRDTPFSSSDSATYYAGGLPSSCNNFERGVLPPVRNQGDYGACWAFSAVAAMEADLIHDGNAGTDIDLSELHLAYFTYHDYDDGKGCADGDHISGPGGLAYLDVGGSAYYAAKALCNLIGPVRESLVPYSRAAQYAPPKTEGRVSGTAQVASFYMLDLEKNPADIKEAIMQHGAVSAVYNDADTNYSATNNSYYNPTKVPTNHVIALVGWDDSFSRSKFRSGTPEGDGAWLVRNSWGKNEYCHEGYFWLSYYDKSLAWDAYAFDMQPWQYENCYAYDHAIESSYYYGSDCKDYHAGDAVTQRFLVDGGEQVEALGIEVQDAANTLSFTVSCGGRSAKASLSYSQPGYYMVRLSEALPVAQRSAVTVSYTCSRDFKVWVETDVPASSPICGHTYTTAFGSGGFTVTGYDAVEADARVKLFTNSAVVPSPAPASGFPSNLQRIESEAFAGCAITSVRLSDQVVSIGPRAFADCTKLTDIVIPASVTQIDDSAFAGVTGLTIRGEAGSAAAKFAAAHGFAFVPAA